MKKSENGIIFYENHQFPKYEGNYETILSVVESGTFEVAQKQKSVCLNFGSKEYVGGGYEAVMDICKPIRTQEEDLFRRSDLVDKVVYMRKYYPLGNLCGIYCECKVLKDNCLNIISPFETAIITVPAVIEPSSKTKVELGRKKMRLILDIAADNKAEVLILGAWGCGVYNNNPVEIASSFKGFLESDYKNVFREVIFAISGGINYDVFCEVIG